jgi:hypothetical protein
VLRGSKSRVDLQSNSDNARKLIAMGMDFMKDFTGTAAQAPPSERQLSCHFLVCPQLHLRRSSVI